MSKHFVRDIKKELVIVLKMLWELYQKLPHTIEILNEHRRSLLLIVISVILAKSEMELMAER